MKLVLATSNKNKVNEIQPLVPSNLHLMSLHDIHCFEDIPETQETIAGNASQKAFHIYKKYHYNCFADDTGLEIDALNGKPGVYSARYAGEHRNDNENIEKVLKELNGIDNRNARFRTVISLVIDGVEYLFEGVVEGFIHNENRGSNGFGYDPIFCPNEIAPNLKNNANKTFAEMQLQEKNLISHRAIAVNKLVEYLHKHY
jgi:XTP/dITP diphosphohydrolase